MLEKFRKALRNWATKVYIDITGSPLKQGENLAPQGEAASDPAMSELLCRAAAEGGATGRSTIPKCPLRRTS